MTMPRVSVRIPAYNHGKYIRECLQSVLEQTFQDFEIVITDDGSTDDTVEIIRSFSDPRIHLEVFPENRGLTITVANCCQRANGEYIANLCSDDAWEKDKLEKQVRFLDAHPDIAAVFTKPFIIGEDGQPIPCGNQWYHKVFEVDNRPREQWLRQFFLNGNCLCMPSVMIRKSIYDALKYQDLRLASLSDFDLWVRCCLHHEIYVLDERLTRLRIRDNDANMSGDRLSVRVRTCFESSRILNHFLQIHQIEVLKAVFPECRKYGEPTQDTIPYFLSRLAIDAVALPNRLWGVETLHAIMADPILAGKLEQLYGFRYTDFYKITSETDIFQLGVVRLLESEVLVKTEQLRVRDEQDVERELANKAQSEKQESERLHVINALSKELMTLSGKMKDDDNRLRSLVNEKSALEAEVTGLRDSTSWRITLPLRAAGRLIRRLRRGG